MMLLHYSLLAAVVCIASVYTQEIGVMQSTLTKDNTVIENSTTNIENSTETEGELQKTDNTVDHVNLIHEIIEKNQNSSLQSRNMGRSQGSAMTAAVMIGAPLLAGALYAGAVAPENLGKKKTSPSNRRSDDSNTGPNADDDRNFTWQTLFQRTVGNIRNTANYFEDQVLDFLDDMTDLGDVREAPPPPPTKVEDSLPPTPEPPIVVREDPLPVPKIKKPIHNPRRQISGPNKPIIEGTKVMPGDTDHFGSDTVRVKIPFINGVPVVADVNGVPVLPFTGEQKVLENLDGLPYIQNPRRGKPKRRRNQGEEQFPHILEDLDTNSSENRRLVQRPRPMRKRPNGPPLSSPPFLQQEIRMFDSELGWHPMQAERRRNGRPSRLQINEAIAQAAMDSVRKSNEPPKFRGRPLPTAEVLEGQESIGSLQRLRHRNVRNNDLPIMRMFENNPRQRFRFGKPIHIDRDTGIPHLMEIPISMPPELVRGRKNRPRNIENLRPWVFGGPMHPMNAGVFPTRYDNLHSLREAQLSDIPPRPLLPHLHQREIAQLTSLAHNHRYITSSEEQRTVAEYSNSNNLRHIGGHQRQNFPGSMKKAFPQRVGDKAIDSLGEPGVLNNFTTSFKVINVTENIIPDHYRGRTTFSQIYGPTHPVESTAKDRTNARKRSPQVSQKNNASLGAVKTARRIPPRKFDSDTLRRIVINKRPHANAHEDSTFLYFEENPKKSVKESQKGKNVVPNRAVEPIFRDTFKTKGNTRQYPQEKRMRETNFDNKNMKIDEIKFPSYTNLFDHYFNKNSNFGNDFNSYDYMYNTAPPNKLDYETYSTEAGFIEKLEPIHSINLGVIPKASGVSESKSSNPITTANDVPRKRTGNQRRPGIKSTTQIPSIDFRNMRNPFSVKRRPFWSNKEMSSEDLSNFRTPNPAKDSASEISGSQKQSTSKGRQAAISAELLSYHETKSQGISGDEPDFDYYDGDGVGKNKQFNNYIRRRMDSVSSNSAVDETNDEESNTKEAVEDSLEVPSTTPTNNLRKIRRKIRRRRPQSQTEISSQMNNRFQNFGAEFQNENSDFNIMKSVESYFGKKLSDEENKSFGFNLESVNSPKASSNQSPDYMDSKLDLALSTERLYAPRAEESPIGRIRERINHRLGNRRRRPHPANKELDMESGLDMDSSHSVSHPTFSRIQSTDTKSTESDKLYFTKPKDGNSETSLERLRRLGNSYSSSSNIARQSTPFKSTEAINLKNEVSVRDKMNQGNEPEVITLEDMKSDQNPVSNRQFISMLEDDPIVSNLKAAFLEDASGNGNSRSKSLTLDDEEISRMYPVTGSFVDPSGRMNNPIRSFNLRRVEPFSNRMGLDFGSMEAIQKLHLTPQDLFKKDNSNYASFVMSSEMNFDNSNRRRDANSPHIIQGKIFDDSMPRDPSSSSKITGGTSRRLIKVARPRRRNHGLQHTQESSRNPIRVVPSRTLDKKPFGEEEDYYESVYELPSLQALVQDRDHANTNKKLVNGDKSSEEMKGISFGESVQPAELKIGSEDTVFDQNTHDTSKLTNDEDKVDVKDSDALNVSGTDESSVTIAESDNSDKKFSTISTEAPADTKNKTGDRKVVASSSFVDVKTQDSSSLHYPSLSHPEPSSVTIPLTGLGEDGRALTEGGVTDFLKALWRPKTSSTADANNTGEKKSLNYESHLGDGSSWITRAFSGVNFGLNPVNSFSQKTEPENNSSPDESLTTT